MTRERLVTTRQLSDEEEKQIWSLRPHSLAEYIGQARLVEKLNVAIEAAQARQEPLDHILFYGPPGLGKTTLAHIIAHEMKSDILTASGPSLVKPGDLMGILTNLKNGDVFFIDEIHRMNTSVEEFLYPAMEDYKIDFLVDSGPHSRLVKFKLEHFTLVGATTRAGFLSAPLRDRFGLTYHLDFYPPEELKLVVERSSRILGLQVEQEAARIIAERSRGTPRICNRLLRRVRDYAQVRGDGSISPDVVVDALKLEGVDEAGLDELDRKYLRLLIGSFSGGPAGIEALAAAMNEETDTLRDMVEPFLLKIGFLKRTKRGRMASPAAREHLGLKEDDSLQARLL